MKTESSNSIHVTRPHLPLNKLQFTSVATATQPFLPSEHSVLLVTTISCAIILGLFQLIFIYFRSFTHLHLRTPPPPLFLFQIEPPLEPANTQITGGGRIDAGEGGTVFLPIVFRAQHTRVESKWGPFFKKRREKKAAPLLNQ